MLTPRLEVNVGEPTETHKSRPMRVVAIEDAAAEGVRHTTLASDDGNPLPAFTPGAHLDLECGDTGITRQYSLCGPVPAPVQPAGCPAPPPPPGS